MILRCQATKGGVQVPMSMFLIAAISFVVVLLLIKALWAWTIPDLFPGAVEQGLVARSVSWGTAAKIALFVAVLGALVS